jgi:hypothetical protein
VKTQLLITLLVVMGWSSALRGQSPATGENLPQAPVPGSSMNQAGAAGQPQTNVPPPGLAVHLSLKDAESIALKNNPTISVAR